MASLKIRCSVKTRKNSRENLARNINLRHATFMSDNKVRHLQTSSSKRQIGLV